MRLKDGTIVETAYLHRLPSRGKILGPTSAAIGTRLD
jgi:hypothetical protein